MITYPHQPPCTFRIQVHGRHALLIGTASTVCAKARVEHVAGEPLSPAGVVRPPTPTAITPGATAARRPPLDLLVLRAVQALGAREPGVMPVDHLESAARAPGRRGHAGDRGTARSQHSNPG